MLTLLFKNLRDYEIFTLLNVNVHQFSDVHDFNNPAILRLKFLNHINLILRVIDKTHGLVLLVDFSLQQSSLNHLEYNFHYITDLSFCFDFSVAQGQVNVPQFANLAVAHPLQDFFG
jgi:hypothetical protein